MFQVTDNNMNAIGLFLEGFFYGLYSGVFAMYLQYHQASKKDTSKTQNIVFYSICALYVLSIAVYVSDIVNYIFQVLSKPPESFLRISIIQSTSFGCCDFIAQFILIYRCWIVWRRNIRVVIIPSILAIAFLVIWLVSGSLAYISSDGITEPHWVFYTTLLGLALSLTVNALVTGLIVFRIFKVFREVKATLDGQILGATGGSKLRRAIFTLIESGTALFSIQLARFVVTFVWTEAAVRAFDVLVTIHQMVNGMAPTIILVRTSMGLSFDDEKSMEEVAIGSLRFAFDHPNSVPETGIIEIVGEEGRDDDDINVERSSDIHIVER